MEQVKPVGRRTGTRILSSVNPHAVKRWSPALPVAAALMLCLGVSACASKKPPEAWLQDKPIVTGSIKGLQKGQQSIEEEIGVLKGRLIELEQARMIRTSAMNARNASIGQLQTRMARLEAMATRSKKSSRITKRKLVKKLDKIVKSISQPVVAAPVQPPVEEEKNHYTAAYLALKSGRYKEATQGFRRLLKSFPKGEYTDQTWYWLGESYYAQHKLKQAIDAFEMVVVHHPKSSKHAAALLKLGLAYKGVSRTGDASTVWQRLIRKYPDSAAAEQARRQLKGLTGH